MQEFAEQLATLSGNSTVYWLQQLPLLAAYFAASAVSAAAAIRLQVALGQHWPSDVRATLLQLSPSCETLLLSCHLDALQHNCSQLFQLTPTIDGNCCVLQPENITGSLTLRLNASHEDDFKMPRVANTAGFTLHLPGWLGKRSLSPGEFTSLELHAIRLQADEQLRNYPLKERGCHFPDEEPVDHMVQCLPQCRLRSAIAACNCAPALPFDLSADFVGQHNYRYCNLANTLCLQHLEGEL